MLRLFWNRSSRVIAITRLALAASFLWVVYSDPFQPVRGATIGPAVFFGYLVAAMAQLVIAWRHWWLDFRFTTLSYSVDVSAFLFAVYATESATSELVSPFLAFFVFLIVSASLKWAWKGAIAAAAIAICGYLCVSIVFGGLHQPHDLLHLQRRFLFMAVFGSLLAWYGMHRVHFRAPAFEADEDFWNGSLGEAALEYAMGVLGAKGGAIAWTVGKRPWSEVAQSGSLGKGSYKLARTDFSMNRMCACEPDSIGALIFDTGRDHCLALTGDVAVTACAMSRSHPLANLVDCNEGLLFAVEATNCRGAVLLTGIDGLCRDDLPIAFCVSRELAAAIDRLAVLEMARKRTIDAERKSFARDLHDGVSQSLAAACFRLEGLRRTNGIDPGLATDVSDIQSALRSEQQQVQAMIRHLREPPPAPSRRDLYAELRQTLVETARKWKVEIAVKLPDSPRSVPQAVVHEMLQIAREAVANACRHGGARRIEVNATETGGAVELAIRDNGSGFSGQDEARPRSILERVTGLGGTLKLTSTSNGASLWIFISMQKLTQQETS